MLQEFYSTPDVALVKLARRVPEFSRGVRPICLNSGAVLEKPSVCPDQSHDMVDKGYNQHSLERRQFGTYRRMDRFNIEWLEPPVINLISARTEEETRWMRYNCGLGQALRQLSF